MLISEANMKTRTVKTKSKRVNIKEQREALEMWEEMLTNIRNEREERQKFGGIILNTKYLTEEANSATECIKHIRKLRRQLKMSNAEDII